MNRRWTDRGRTTLAAARRSLAAAPATLVYLFTILVTWWTLRGADERLGRHLVASASTNLANMQRDPLQVLVASAFWLDPGSNPVTMIAELLLLGVAVERWLGTWRWIAVFAIGHVGATSITVLGIAYAVDHGLLGARVAHVSDVGYSYGLMALAGVFGYRWRGRLRLAWVGGFAVVLGYAFFKFGWAYRLFNYAAILIGATPPADHPDAAARERAAARAARMNVAAGRHFARGQRAVFFALAYLGWFVGPLALAATTLFVLAVMIHRQFASDARDAILPREAD